MHPFWEENRFIITIRKNRFVLRDGFFFAEEFNARRKTAISNFTENPYLYRTMIAQFKSYISDKKLCSSRDEIMLAVSGGVDSVVMTDLFYEAGYKCAILHCNFGLRDEDSDADEAFVRSLAAKYEFPVYVKKFDTRDYAEENGISIQMAARDLRYQWFDQISEKQEVSFIATAHNMNDSVETVLLNLSRGTGLKGLTGIPVLNGKYIRPLLFSPRKQILEYCKSRGLQYREDVSNASRKYKRNKIRHDLIPLFEEINPAFVRTMNDNIQRFLESHQIYREEVVRVRNVLFRNEGSYIEISLDDLKKLNPISSWLYELFSDFGFSMNQCLNIEKILYSESGKQFVSPTYRLYKDRNNLLLTLRKRHPSTGTTSTRLTVRRTSPSQWILKLPIL